MLKPRNMRPNRKNLRESSTQSPPSCIKVKLEQQEQQVLDAEVHIKTEQEQMLAPKSTKLTDRDHFQLSLLSNCL